LIRLFDQQILLRYITSRSQFDDFRRNWLSIESCRWYDKSDDKYDFHEEINPIAYQSITHTVPRNL